jgi:hypothetical protein
MKGLRAAFVLLAVALLGTGSSYALVVNYGTGTENTTDPGFDLPWNNVGRTAGGQSGVYLGAYNGQYWVATATHVGAANLILGGTTYSAVAGSAVQIAGDLTLFRISSDPGLSNLTIASATPSLNELVTMVGFGRVEADYTKWNINTATNPDTWTTTTGSTFDKHGYTTSAGGVQRWGFGGVSVTGANYDVGSGQTQAFALGFLDGVFAVSASAASFGSNAVSLSMGQAGDSGGAVFAYNQTAGRWELAGIMGAIGTFSGASNPNGQPGNTAVFGNLTLAIDLATYQSSINQTLGAAAIPEPGTIALACGLVVLVGAIIHRRRRR